MASTSRSTWASKASNELHNLQGLEQELDLQLEEARELKQSLELNLEYDTALLSEMTSEADAPSHDTCIIFDDVVEYLSIRCTQLKKQGRRTKPILTVG